jgi:hypothetical protein
VWLRLRWFKDLKAKGKDRTVPFWSVVVFLQGSERGPTFGGGR